ncbi:hypothetical protein EJ05DRAFT_458272 [Pseudovirgaria hyperparasitica]|uniref:Aminoglycoside phosphotransferase domain-containing protein n=1 Tax=Pseudovirgaria hyperparasitica TaxID=470096 RepID=A0A6A6VSR9_9PEZI|nr:uncharacterized protein EJ05DRAFT_458272 [Pseudovirgaria hyperparasitica]KAF2753263.1 hypothetical protein EJ05DRAFT_458272 [Pseudovirgaria hyperparasitica]
MTSQQVVLREARLNWKTNIDSECLPSPIDWKALEEYAISFKRKRSNYDGEITCNVSAEYNMGGLHVVRRLDFQDGTTWVARLQLQKATPESLERLLNEVHTIQVIRERSRIPVPELFTYEASDDNAVGVAFMIMEFVPADTAMDSFGGWPVHRGKIPAPFRRKFYTGMAKIQVELASVRFPKIGSIIKLSNGEYSVGPIPRIGGPFDSAADFFEAWAKCAKFPYSESTIRARTPSNLVDRILISIRDFPSQLAKFAKHHSFQEGPFPIIHTDLYTSNILVDSMCCIQSVIDWENTIVAPWEMVEFIKDLSIVPPVMDGPLYNETESDRELLAERKRYIEVIQTWERVRQLDSKLSTVLDHWNTQSLAHAIWLYLEGRIGFYTDVFKSFELE